MNDRYDTLLAAGRRKITRDAQKRLQVLQQFTELGAGFQIASHDLELRGAGNLLGPDQSGAIAAVGFDLYTQLMEEAVAELKGVPLQTEFEPDVDLPVPALIPEDYVPEVSQRLFFYKRLANAATEEELYDVKGELRDQCGETPVEVDALVEVMSLKNALRALRMRGLKSGPGRLIVQLGPEAALDPVRLAAECNARPLADPPVLLGCSYVTLALASKPPGMCRATRTAGCTSQECSRRWSTGRSPRRT